MTAQPASADLLNWFRNIGAGYADAAVGGAVYLVLTPLLVRHLGPEGYAIWVISHTVTFYLHFLDFGFGEAQIRLHARYLALQRQRLFERLIATVIVALSVAGVLAGAIGMLIAVGPLHLLVDVSKGLQGDLQMVLVVLAANVIIAIPASALWKFYEGVQRFDIQNLRSITLRILSAGGQLSLLHRGYGIVALAVVELAATCLGLLFDMVLVQRLVPGLLRVPAKFHRQIWRRIRHFALWTSVNDLIKEGATNLDQLLVAALLPLVLLTPYALALTLAGALYIAVRPITETFFPMATAMHARHQYQRLARLLFFGTKLTTAIAIPLAIFLIFFGNAVLVLWVPEAAADASGALVSIIVLNRLFSVFVWTSSVLLLALNRIGLMAVVTLLQIAIEVILTVMLAPRFGLTGVALGSLIANVGVGAMVTLPIIGRATATSGVVLLRKVLGRLLLASIPACLVAQGLRLTQYHQGVLFLGMAAASVGAVYLLALLRFGTSASERSELMEIWRSLRQRGAPSRAGEAQPAGEKI
jgi:O-antigen/teichoic acid export membrane protein